MGEVWRAYDTAMNRVVALKVLPANLADDAQYQVRFRREAQAAASLDEPHIVPIHDFGEVDGRLYVTMRLIDGKTINELVADGPVAPRSACLPCAMCRSLRFRFPRPCPPSRHRWHRVLPRPNRRRRQCSRMSRRRN
jgi:serine/threonine protein kinase